MKTSQVNTRCTAEKNNVDHNIHQNTTQHIAGKRLKSLRAVINFDMI